MTYYIVRVQQWFRDRLAAMPDDDRGAITTETAVVTFLLIALALGIIAAIGTYAEGVVDSFPSPGG